MIPCYNCWRSSEIRILKFIERFFNLLIQIILVILAVFLVVITFSQVLFRYIEGIDFSLSQELGRQLVLWLTFMGAGLVTLRRRHLAFDLIPQVIRGHAKEVYTVFIYLIGTGISFYLTVVAFRFLKYERESGVLALGGIPSWWLELIIPMGMSLISFLFLLVTIQELFRIIADKR